ncbi:MAG: hypothetical protein UR14_C0005G0008 [candidate division TM6 bacterium GW2011_GWE2_31_21]|nr:MAG: hypothetical protein UR14_C0005G0008 [candidate division TM6 bacterium GW2011_GWE2_31_21]KKP53084.1 MAG: hypothetical protein UR43_C0007G0008 [candidate division TM6 bacterium GW2011_GWF2_33_332]
MQNKFKKENSMILVSIEGNAGAGKTTFFKVLESKLKGKNINAAFIPEPVNKWLNIKDEKGENLLGNFYKNTPRWAYTIQTAAFFTKLDAIMQAAQTKVDFIITERSIYSDQKIFIPAIKIDNNISDFEEEIYSLSKPLFQTVTQNLKIKNVIYLRCSPQTAMKRIASRGRPEETVTPFAYIQSLHDKHEQWLMDSKNSFKVLTIDNELDFDTEKHETQFDEMIDQVIKFLNNLKQQ